MGRDGEVEFPDAASGRQKAGLLLGCDETAGRQQGSPRAGVRAVKVDDAGV